MAKDVRCVLFAPEEVRAAVADFLVHKRQIKAGLDLERVDLAEIEGVVFGKARIKGPNGTETARLDVSELMASLLILYRQNRIPLSSQAVKKLEASHGGLALVMSTNLEHEPTLRPNAPPPAPPPSLAAARCRTSFA